MFWTRERPDVSTRHLPRLIFGARHKVRSAEAFAVLRTIPARLAGRGHGFAQVPITSGLLVYRSGLVRQVRPTEVLTTLGCVLAGLSVPFGRLTSRGQRRSLLRDIHELLPGQRFKLSDSLAKSRM